MSCNRSWQAIENKSGKNRLRGSGSKMANSSELYYARIAGSGNIWLEGAANSGTLIWL